MDVDDMHLSRLQEVFDDVSSSGIVDLAEGERAGSEGGLLADFAADLGVVDDRDQLLDGSARILIQQGATSSTTREKNPI